MKIGDFSILVAAALIFGCVQLSASITKTDSLQTVAKQADNQSLVLVNITNTLYTSETTLGDSLWKDYFSNRVHELIQDRAEADEIVNTIKNKIVNAVPKKLVEPDTAQTIAALQSKKIPVIGFTTKHLSRPYEERFADLVNSYLTSLGIHLEDSNKILALNANSTAYQYLYGIIFTSSQPKDAALKAFLANISSKKPAKVLVVDTNENHLKDIQKALEGSPYAFLGFQYQSKDSRSNNFDKDLGTIQLQEFLSTEEVISDQQARQIKHHNPSQNYSAILDKLILNLSKK